MSPIRPENAALYPDNWGQIAFQIKERAGWQCEGCGVEAGADRGGKRGVVLTCAHLDHDPSNVDPENLRAWCEQCHNSYDAPVRSANRRKRLAAQAGQLEMLGEEE